MANKCFTLKIHVGLMESACLGLHLHSSRCFTFLSLGFLICKVGLKAPTSQSWCEDERSSRHGTPCHFRRRQDGVGQSSELDRWAHSLTQLFKAG